MKHCFRLSFFLATISILILLFCSAAYADEIPALVWYAENDDSVCVNVQNQGTYYLFLPSSADYSALKLSAPADTVLSGSDSDISISLNAGERSVVDLTAIFGEMAGGERYTLLLNSTAGRTSVVLMKSENLSSMHIEIAGDLEKVNKSEDKSVAFPGSYCLIDSEGSVTASGLLDWFKGRGNSSWVRSNGKQPYNIKLTNSAELIPGSGKSKRWALVSENVQKHDVTGLSNRTAMQLYRDLGGECALDSDNIDLYVNGEYRGMYMLSEKVTFSDGVIDISDPVYTYEDDQNATMIVQPGGVKNKPNYWQCVPIKSSDTFTILTLENSDEDPAIASGIQAYKYGNESEISSMGGYLLELDFRFYEEDAWFITRRGTAVVVRNPEHPGRTELQKIAIYIQRFEDALFSADGFNSQGEYYGDLLNLESQVKMYLLDSFICNRDAHRASSFYYAGLDSSGEIMQLNAGPAWDYNSVDLSAVHFFGNDIGTAAYNIMWMTQLASHGDFLNLLGTMNKEVLVPAVEKLIEGDFEDSIDLLSASQKMNGVLWQNNYETNASQYFQSLSNRFAIWCNELWTDDKLLGLEMIRDGDNLSVHSSGTVEKLTWYRYDDVLHTIQELPDVEGTEYSPTEPGIYTVSASGANIIYNARSALFMNDYSPNGMASFSTKKNVTAFSNYVDTRVPEKPEEETEVESEVISEEGISDVTVSDLPQVSMDSSPDSDANSITVESADAAPENQENIKRANMMRALICIVVVLCIIKFASTFLQKRRR